MSVLTDILLFLILIFVILLGVTGLINLLLKVPYVPSSTKALRALDHIHFTGKEHVCDLGSGDGKVLFYLRKKYPTMTLTGYELAILPFLYAVVKNNILNTHIQFVYKNFLDADLKPYDTYFCYLMPGMLHKIIHKIASPQKNKQLITNTFRMETIKPTATIPITGTTAQLYIYTL